MNAARAPEVESWAGDGRIAFYYGDGSERCLVCAWRCAPSLYVGQAFFRVEDGWPERFPVCSHEHGLMWMRRVWTDATDLQP